MGRLRIERITGPPGRLVGPDGTVLAQRCHVARGAWARAVGLLGTPHLDDGEALWLPRCASVHTVGMRAVIGCAFLDADGCVLRVVDPLVPWRVAGASGARAAVECTPGILAGVPVGARLRLVPLTRGLRRGPGRVGSRARGCESRHGRGGFPQ